MTSTVPAAWGATCWTTIWVALFTVKHGLLGVTGQGEDEMSTAPKNTSEVVNVPDSKAVPVMVTLLVTTPAAPARGDTAVTVGNVANVYVSLLDVGLVPPGVVTVTSTAAAACAGTLLTVMDVGLFSVKHAWPGDPGHC